MHDNRPYHGSELLVLSAFADIVPDPYRSEERNDGYKNHSVSELTTQSNYLLLSHIITTTRRKQRHVEDALIDSHSLGHFIATG